MKNSSELLKKPEMPIVVSIVAGCAQSPRFNVPVSKPPLGDFSLGLPM